MWQPVIDILVKAGLEILAVVVGLAVTFLCAKIRKYFEQKQISAEKKELAKQVVLAVEQMYYELEGEEKLEKALEMASTALKEKKINIEATELRMLIESAVASFNDVFNKKELKEGEGKEGDK